MHLSRLYFLHGLQTQRETTALRHFALISDFMYKVITFQKISAPKFCVYSLSVNFKINNYGSSVTKLSFHGLDDWCDSQQGHVWCFLSLSWETEALNWCWDYRCMELYLCVHICLDGMGLNTGTTPFIVYLTHSR